MRQARGFCSIGSDNDRGRPQGFSRSQNHFFGLNRLNPREQSDSFPRQPRCQLFRDRCHAAGRHSIVTKREHAKDELELAARRRQLGFQEHAPKERSEESLDHRLAEAR